MPSIRLRLSLVGFDRRHGNTVTPAKPPVATLRLDGREAIYVRANLLGLSKPGFYKLRIGPAFDGPNNMSNHVEFELRALTGRAERAEFHLRRIWEATTLGGRCQPLMRHIRAVLAEHPSSVAAFEQLGSCSINEGRKSAALSAFSRALDLLEKRLDDLYIATHAPHEVERRAARLRGNVAAPRAGRPLPPVLVH
jgi:hypothetical protein